jgi:hypothetical protein
VPPGHRPAPPVDTIRVAVSGTVLTLPFTNVYWLQVTTDGTKTAADLKVITDAFVAALFLRMKAQISSSVIFTDAKAVWITAVGGEIAYEGTYADVCTGAGTNNNTSSSIVLQWSINAYYRGGHPRTYMPGPISGNVTNGSTLTAAYATALAAAATLWLSDTNALTGTHILTTKLGTVSFASALAWRVPPIFRAYQSVSVRSFMGTQRRRIGGR